MQYGSIPGIEKPVSRLVQGTIMINGSNQESEWALLDAVFALGCQTFDTAHTYAGGNNEPAVGAWVRSRGVRDQVVIIGKGAHPDQERNRVTPEDITADLHESLERFGFDQIDIYLLHRDDPAVPVGPIVEVLNQHQRAGKIGIFGGSNWSAARIAEANDYARERGLTPFAVSSPNFSLAEQLKPPWDGCLTISGPAYAADRAWYGDQRMPLFTWSSLAGGFLTGRFRRDNLATFSNYFDALAVSSYASEANFVRLDRAEQLATEKGLSLPQIALAYVLSQPLDIYAITAPNSEAECRASMAAAEVRLTADEISWLES